VVRSARAWDTSENQFELIAFLGWEPFLPLLEQGRT